MNNDLAIHQQISEWHDAQLAAYKADNRESICGHTFSSEEQDAYMAEFVEMYNAKQMSLNSRSAQC